MKPLLLSASELDYLIALCDCEVAHCGLDQNSGRKAREMAEKLFEARQAPDADLSPIAPPNDVVRKIFHRLWSDQVGKPGYNKGQWGELARLLRM